MQTLRWESVLTIQYLWASVSDREGVDLIWVGDEALIESTQAQALPAPPAPPVSIFFSEMVMYPPGTVGDFGPAGEKKEELETETAIAIPIADLGSETTTFWLVILLPPFKSAQTNTNYTLKQSKNRTLNPREEFHDRSQYQNALQRKKEKTEGKQRRDVLGDNVRAPSL